MSRTGRYLIVAASLVLPALCQTQAPSSYTITTVAGNGATGYAGDGGAATDAQLNSPCAVAVDSSNNLYIADQLNSRVRRVGADGTIKTFAGNGSNSYTGDGGAATSAALSHPCGMAFDSAGNVYIADPGSSVIRKVATNGNITTVAGDGTADYIGDGGPATSAELNHPVGVAVDTAGNLYIADSSNHCIRKVTPDGTITTIAGSGTSGRLGDGGPATSARLNNPQSVTLDTAGNLYIADTNNSVIRKITPDGTISTVAGSSTIGYSGDGGPATSAALNYPKSLVVDTAGNLYMVDSLNGRVRMVTPNGTIRTVAGNGQFGAGGDGGPATSAQFRFPTGVALGAAGKLYVADTQNNRIRLLTPVPQPVAVPPSIDQGGVVGASAFGAFTSAAPGSWIEIYGSNLAVDSRAWGAADFNGVKAPISLDGTGVMIGGQPAFVSYVSPTQVNLQLPSNLGAGSQQITVTTAAGTSAPYTITVNPTQPGLYAPPLLKIGGRQYAGALFTDGVSWVLPSGAVPSLFSRPARPGETIILYGVGFGPVTPSIDAGNVVQQNNKLATPFEILFGQTPATVSYAGLAPGAIGLYQFNVVVPNVAASDAVPLTFTLGGANGTQTLYTAIGN